MCHLEHRHPRSLVNTARLHANETVFHQVDPANAMVAAQLIQFCEHVDRAVFGAVDRDRLSFLERDDYLFRLIRSILL